MELAKEFFKSADGKEILGSGKSMQIGAPGVNPGKAIPLQSPETGEQPITQMTRAEGHDLPTAWGTKLDDIIDAGPVNDGNDTAKGFATIEGGAGHDTAVLKGRPEDYHFSMPQSPLEYPQGEKAWEGQKSLYGERVVATNMQTGDRMAFTGVESIAFDPENKINNPKAVVSGQAASVLGSESTMSIAQALELAEQGMTPEEQQRARLAATPEAAAAMDADPQIGAFNMGDLTQDEIDAKVTGILDNLQSTGVDTTQTYAKPADVPVSPNTLQEAGLQTRQFTQPTGMGGP